MVIKIVLGARQLREASIICRHTSVNTLPEYCNQFHDAWRSINNMKNLHFL